MAKFFIDKKRLPNSAKYDEDPQQGFFDKIKKFHVLVIIALLLVVIIVGSIFYFNYSNNSLNKFVDASCKNFDSGSFAYHITAYLNDQECLDYDGAMEFDLDNQMFESVYHAKYQDYEYDAASYAYKADSYTGTFYGGKWNIEDYADNALDFFAFYRDYREHEFDSGAFLRFTDTNDVFSAVELDKAVDSITSELTKSSSLSNVLHEEVETLDDGSTVYTFKPDVKELFTIISDNIGPAYTSAKEYSQFKETVENSSKNMDNATAVLSYTIDNRGYLTSIAFDYTVNNDNYLITVSMSDFSQKDVEIPESMLSLVDTE